MASKRLKIENLEHLNELNAEEVSLLQGGETTLTSLEPSREPDRLIYVDPDNPKPYPLPVWPPYPCKHHRVKGKDGAVLLHYCPVIL
ncbi:MAG: hypothetical protein QNJ55_12035 [Xenococcus sp. MO_188.B8]|nr:hypothetical protein [Xenococcus sp. MO_188.B8]